MTATTTSTTESEVTGWGQRTLAKIQTRHPRRDAASRAVSARDRGAAVAEGRTPDGVSRPRFKASIRPLCHATAGEA